MNRLQLGAPPRTKCGTLGAWWTTDRTHSKEYFRVVRVMAEQKVVVKVADTPLVTIRDSSSDDNKEWVLIGLEVTKAVIGVGVSVFSMYIAWKMYKYLVDPADSTKESTAAAKKALAKRLQRPDVEDMNFDAYELGLLNDIMGPGEIKETFADIGGMDAQLEEVTDNIVLPMQLWSRFRKIGTFTAEEEELSTCPTGMLLYGQPGTGKTLTAKAVAKESGATFMNIKASSILSKYVGESDKMVSAIFRLARKLAPTVVFIDEIDTVLRKRGGYDGSGGAVQSMQGVFLAEWDGLNQDNETAEVREETKGKIHENRAAEDAYTPPKKKPPVIVLGATNRPTDLDSAFLRRMPVQVRTVMPDATARTAILRAQLREESLASDIDLTALAVAMGEVSGSDIREIVRVAKQHRAKKLLLTLKESQSMVADTESGDNNRPQAGVVRALTLESFEHALRKYQASASTTHAYGQAQNDQEARDRFNKAVGSLFASG